MSKVSTNNVSVQYAIESTIGVLPGSPLWQLMEPNDIGSYGATLTTVSRRPISKDRGRRKGTVTNLETSPEFEGDLTLESMEDFSEGFVYAEFANVEFDMKSTGGIVPPPVASAATWTIESMSALLGGKLQFVAAGPWPLVHGKGYTNSANNGLHQLTVDPASTDVILTTDSTLVVETPGTNASLQVAGVRSAIGDLALTISGSLATIVSAADITDWATLGLLPGMEIHIGSDDGTGGRQNMFDDGAAGDVYGFARIESISGATLNLAKLDVKLTTTDASNATLVDIMFGRFARNVQVTDDSDDTRYLERSYHFELAYPDLGGAGVDEYEYAVGNMANEIALNVPLADKATVNWGFVGTNVENITPTRKTNAATAVEPLRTTALNTSSNLVSISTDVISAVSDVCFKSMTLTIKNNASPEQCLGTLGASFVNTGLFEVSLEGQMLFTDKAIVNAVKNNTTVTFQAILANEDGAIALDIPTMTFGDGSREFPTDQSVLVNVTGETFKGSVFDHEIGITMLASVPTDRT